MTDPEEPVHYLDEPESDNLVAECVECVECGNALLGHEIYQVRCFDCQEALDD